MIFDEGHLASAAAERFNANRAGAREDIDKARVGNAIGQNIEKSFAQAVARWAESEALRALEKTAAKFSGDDTHGRSIEPQPM